MKKPAILITGGGTGIGAAVARLFSEAGHPVCIAGRRLSKLRETASALKGECFSIEADVSSRDGVDRLVSEALRQTSGIGILVNNAAAFQTGPFAQASDDVWNLDWQTNVMGPVRLARALYENFKKLGGGVVVNVASTAGLRPVSGMAPYVVTKAALISLTQSLALEWAKDGIRVNAVCPGIVETPIHGWDEISNSEKKVLSERWRTMHPLGRAGRPLDVARAVTFLCQPENDWITGAAFPVDGGISLT